MATILLSFGGCSLMYCIQHHTGEPEKIKLHSSVSELTSSSHNLQYSQIHI